MGNGPVDSGTQTSEGQAALLMPPKRQNPKLEESDRAKAKMLWQLLSKGKSYKQTCGWSENEENWDYWDTKQWKRTRAASLHMAQVNETFSTVETFTGHLQDNIPDTIVRPRRADHIPVAQLVTKLINWSDDLNDLHSAVEDPVRSALIAGTGIWRIDWDMSSDGWRGAPKYRFVDENFFFLAPFTTRQDECRWMIEARNIPIDYVRETWERGAEVQPGVWDGTLSSFNRTGSDSGNPGGFGDYSAFTTTQGNYTQVSKGMQSQRNKDLVTLIEAWIKQQDGTMRYMVCCNGIILEDGPSPYDDEEFPYVIFNVIRRKNTLLGRSLVGVIKGLQDIINQMTSYMLDAQKYESDSPLVVDVANLEESQNITNAAGSMYVNVNPNGPGYQLLTKPGANPRYLDIIEQFKTHIREITGGVDILRGEHPAGVQTLGAMEIMRDEANVLVNKMVKQILTGLKRKDKLVINRLRQFMKDERTVRITTGKGDTEFVTVNEKQSMNDATGEYVVGNIIPDDFEADVDFSIEPPGGMQAKMERDLALLQAGVIDAQFVLEDLEFDQEQIDAITERQQAQAEAEQQAAAAQAAPGAGGVPQGPAPGYDPSQMDEGAIVQKAMELVNGVA